MKFTLDGEIIFSKDAEEAFDDIEKFIEQANSDIFLKGIPEDQMEDASRIVDWKLKENTLKLKIISGRRGRAHDALLRMKKPLSQVLGPKYHMGIRKIHVNDYEIEIPTEKKVEIEISDIPHVSDVLVKEDKVILKFKDLKEGDLRKHVIDRIVSLSGSIIGKSSVSGTLTVTMDKEEPTDILTKKVTKATPGEIIAKSRKREYLFDGDPTEEAAKLGWAKKFPGRGQWFYTPPMVALQRVIEDIIMEKLVYKMGFVECLFPKLIPIPVMHKMRYLEGLPEGMYYCCAPRRDPETFEKFKNELVIKHEVPIDLLKEGLKDPSYVLAPAQCEPFYEFLSHEVVDEEELPIKFFDRSGWTYRWEAGGAKGMDRVHEFQRIELVWLGTPQEVEKLRDKTVEISQKIADGMELEWYTEVGDDPFYLEGRKVEERGIEFPDIPKHEMRISVPNQEKGVAVVSANVHGTHFVEGFSIKEAHRHKIWTGCTGVGVSRWVFGFLAQKGFDSDKWPDEVKKRFKKIPVPKLLTWP